MYNFFLKKSTKFSIFKVHNFSMYLHNFSIYSTYNFFQKMYKILYTKHIQFFKKYTQFCIFILQNHRMQIIFYIHNYVHLKKMCMFNIHNSLYSMYLILYILYTQFLE